MMTMYPTIPTVLKEGVELPAYAHEGDAGLDLCATEDVTLLPGEWKKIGSGVSMAIPVGFVGLLVPRSGLGCKGLVLKHEIGVIDSCYRGEIKLPLLNNNRNRLRYWMRGFLRFAKYMNCKLEPEGTIHVHKGDRVAQLLIVPVAIAHLMQVDTLEESVRKDAGFGSTGVRL